MGRGKYTAQEALEALPEPTLECPVVRVLGPRGQHLHEVAIASSLVSSEINGRLNADKKDWFTTLVQLPPKFRSVVWVKRGSYVLADLSEQLTDKIGGEVALVLMADQVKHLKQNKQWPNQYDDLWDEMASGQDPAAARCDDDEDNSNREKGSDENEENADSDMDDELMMGGGNPNRRHMSSDEDDSSDEE